MTAGIAGWTSDRFDGCRELFEIPEAIAYLNCANLAPQLRSVAAACESELRRQAAPWTLRAEDWFAPGERLRTLFARIVNADVDGIALVPAVSYGIALAAANLEVGRGQSIILLENEFPSNVYAWRELARRRGAVVRTVARPSSGAWTDAVIDAIGDETAVVSVPNCHWTDGRLVDLRRVAPAARAAGAALVIDASQSAGAYPIDIAALQPDFLVTVGYKWLLGPYGLSYLYAAPRWRTRGVPLEHSWLTREGAEDFTRLTEYSDAFRPGARRFDMGEFSQFVLTAMATAALEQVLAWGVDRIQDRASALAFRIEREAAAAGALAVPRNDRVGHLVGVRPTSGVSRTLMKALTTANVYVSIRGDSIRVAPHVYNDDEDVDRLIAVLRENAAST